MQPEFLKTKARGPSGEGKESAVKMRPGFAGRMLMGVGALALAACASRQAPRASELIIEGDAQGTWSIDAAKERQEKNAIVDMSAQDRLDSFANAMGGKWEWLRSLQEKVGSRYVAIKNGESTTLLLGKIYVELTADYANGKITFSVFPKDDGPTPNQNLFSGQSRSYQSIQNGEKPPLLVTSIDARQSIYQSEGLRKHTYAGEINAAGEGEKHAFFIDLGEFGFPGQQLLAIHDNFEANLLLSDGKEGAIRFSRFAMPGKLKGEEVRAGIFSDGGMMHLFFAPANADVLDLVAVVSLENKTDGTLGLPMGTGVIPFMGPHKHNP